MSKFRTIFALAVLGAAGSLLAAPQEVFIYPAGGQSPQQMNQDKSECEGWARQQVRPPASSAPPPQASSGRDGSVMRGAARGAILGEVIDDDAGKGAAAGALIGGMRRADRRRAQQAQQDQYQRQSQQQQQQYDQEVTRAYSTCMQARNYTVG